MFINQNVLNFYLVKRTITVEKNWNNNHKTALLYCIGVVWMTWASEESNNFEQSFSINGEWRVLISEFLSTPVYGGPARE